MIGFFEVKLIGFLHNFGLFCEDFNIFLIWVSKIVFLLWFVIIIRLFFNYLANISDGYLLIDLDADFIVFIMFDIKILLILWFFTYLIGAIFFERSNEFKIWWFMALLERLVDLIDGGALMWQIIFCDEANFLEFGFGVLGCLDVGQEGFSEILL